jgi:hypothetical protein
MGDIARRGRSTKALLVCGAFLVVSAMFADAASAGTVGVNGRIQGAGSIASFEGGPYSCSRTANQDDRETAECPREAFGAVFEASVKLRATPASSPSGHWRFLRWEGCQAVTNGGQDCEVKSGAFSGDERYPKAVFDDFVSPVVSSDGETFGNQSATFFFHSSEPATFFCRMDAGTTEQCGTGTFPPGKSYGGLSEGNHTFSVQAFDASNQGSTTLSRTVTIVNTNITDGPPSLVNTRTATFNYSTGAGNAFECSLDFQAFTACGTGAAGSKTVTVTTDGAHNFRVRAKNGGFTDPVPASHSWTVDTVSPETTLTAGPEDGDTTTSNTATFEFGSSESGTFECKLDGGAFTACASPRTVTNLATGPHTFQVRAKDSAGNTDATPDAVTWTVVPRDNDGDGFNSASDCNDANPNINPSKPEVRNNDVDENCDGKKEYDRDNDGVEAAGDCDDTNAAAHPGKPEVLDNDVDENCDGIKGVNLDRDGDGAQRPADCDDGNPAARPGAVDQPGNGRDEDCDGKDAVVPPPVVQPPDVVLNPTLSARYDAYRKYTIYKRLIVKRVPSGATTSVTCKGKKCPVRTFSKTRGGNVKLARFMKKKLRAGTTLTIRVTKAGTIGKQFVIRIRKGKAPKVTVVQIT